MLPLTLSVFTQFGFGLTTGVVMDTAYFLKASPSETHHDTLQEALKKKTVFNGGKHLLNMEGQREYNTSTLVRVVNTGFNCLLAVVYPRSRLSVSVICGQALSALQDRSHTLR